MLLRFEFIGHGEYLYLELLPLRRALSTIVRLIVGALTIPVSSATTERTFSKFRN